MARSIVAIFFVKFLLYILYANCQRDDGSFNTIVETLRSNPDLTEFAALMDREGQSLRATYDQVGLTIFAPTNEAFQTAQRNKTERVEKDQKLLLYHMVFNAYERKSFDHLDVLNPVFASAGESLFLTKSNNNVFVNNAQILEKSTQTFGKSGKKKIIYVVTELLQPLRTKRNDDGTTFPTAWGLLERSEEFKLENNRINAFADHLKFKGKELEIYRNRGPNTYFIPVDNPQTKQSLNAIDDIIIDAHVVPNKALFLNPSPEYEQYETLAFKDNVKIVISLPRDYSSDDNRKRYAQSRTIVAQKYPLGVVLSEIVLGNIPVQNGVVHLISKPLVIADKTMAQLIDGSVDSQFNLFRQKLVYAHQELRDKLADPKQMTTLFIPSNKAWREASVERTINNNYTVLANILDLHLVPNDAALTVDMIRQKGKAEVKTFAPNKFMFLNLVYQGPNRTLSIECAGVNATAKYTDIAATNGVIHIIDRVLGIPYATVGRKIASDPSLSFTYSMGKYKNFNAKLDDTRQNYTYFVPRDVAWKLFSTQHENLYRAVTTRPDIAYQILERHLIVSGNYTMEDLKRKLRNETIVVPAQQGGLQIRVRDYKEKNGYIIEWKGELVEVFRPDVICINGIVHVIDKVLISDGDINYSIDGATNNNAAMVMLLSILLPLVVMGFYH